MCFRIPVVREEASAVVTHSHSLLSRGPPKAASVWEQGRGPAPLKHTHITIHSLSLYTMTFLFLLRSSRVYYSPGLHQFDPEHRTLYTHYLHSLLVGKYFGNKVAFDFSCCCCCTTFTVRLHDFDKHHHFL